MDSLGEAGEDDCEKCYGYDGCPFHGFSSPSLSELIFHSTELNKCTGRMIVSICGHPQFKTAQIMCMGLALERYLMGI